MSTPGGSTINTAGLGGDIGQIIAAALSGYGALTGSANANAQTIANAVDPQQGVRSQGITQLSQFMSNPEAYLQDPVIQASISQGEEGASRLAGAAGGANSGGRLAAIANQGQQTAFGDMSQRLAQLMQEAQIGNPVARGAALTAGQNNQASNVAGALAGLGPLGSLIQTLMGKSGGGGGGGGPGAGADPGSGPSGSGPDNLSPGITETFTGNQVSFTDPPPDIPFITDTGGGASDIFSVLNPFG